MSTQTVPQNAIVNAVKGEVLVLGLDGKVRSIKAGDELISGEVIITENNASLDVQIHNELYLVDANCVACLPEPSFEQPETLLQSPVNGQVTFDPTSIEGANFDANDVAAIQQAILDGADPTAILEATAAGAGAEGSANAGYVTVEYNNPEVLASTFFETSATRSGVEERDEADDLDVTIFADGGQSLQSSVTEGSISLSSYPQTISSSVLIEAGDLALDTASFVPKTSSLESLLTELNSDITSAGQPVAFVYDEAQNAIIGTQEGNEVLRIEIEATSLGRNLELEVVTTISQGIDHVASVADGQVSISGDQINIAFDITGADIGGNSIKAPIDFTTTVIDGDDPAPQNVTFENVESSSTPITGTFVDIGSDQLATVTFNQEGLSQFDGLLSDNQATEAVLSEDGSTITLSIAGSNETVLTISLNTDGTYQFEQFKPLEQTNGEDTIELSLPTTIVDFDQDTVSNTFTMTILDGDNPVIENVTGLSLDEAGVDQGSQEGAAVTSGTGSITTAVGSDIIDHYELEPTEFNVDGELQSRGQVVQLELASESNGVRTYEGFIELDGVRITVFDVAVDAPTLGEYQFNLYEQLDHTGANDDSLTFSLPVYAVDADGDRSSITDGSNTPEAAQIVIQVQDDVPSIDGVDALAVDEDDLSSIGSDQSDSVLAQGSFTTTQGSDRVVSYQLESGADPLNGLESQGRSISLTETANSDGSFTYSATAAGDAIFTLQVNPDGSYSFTLEGPIDHAVGSDSLTLDFTIVATDFDGDTSSLVLPVTIADDVPTINDVVALTVDEDDLSSVGSDQLQPTLVEGQFTTTQGSDSVVQYQLDVNADPLNGLQSQGQTVSIAETQNADGSYTYSATANGSAVFTLILNTDGSYSFELQGPIDHAADSDSLTLDFSVIATDFDGDTSQIVLPVTIVDDKPTIIDVDAITVDEDDLATIGSDQTDPISIDGTFTTTQGSDRVVSYQLDASATPVNGLTSQGVAVTLTETANGDGSFTYQATAGTELVFTLTVNTDGSYNFTLEGPIDHAVDSDELTLNFPIIATDFDGDTTNATIPVTIVDDKPVITDVDAITVDEDDLASIGSDQSNPISIDGSFITTQGSDRVVSYQLDASSTPVDGLTSQGVAVTLTETANGDGSFTYEATAGGNPVFTLTVDTDNSYNFTLEGPIDHAVDSDEQTLNFPIIATDFDGDTVTEIIPVTIVDDVPTITAVDALNVDEDDLNVVGSDPGGDLFVKGAFTTTQGSDRVVSYQLDSTADPVAGLTSQGEAITLVETANGDGSFTYVATADGNPVFTLNVATDGTYDFTLQGPIDHAVNSDSLTIDFPIVATDFDGDTTTATIPVTITDDAPIIDNVVPLAVDEDDLSGIGSDQSDAVFVEGAFTTTQGSDRVVSYQLDSTADPVAGLTSQGESVTLVETANADGSFTYVATADGNPVFTMNVNADGTYNFRLEGPVDHALNSDELVLNFPIIATDFDGDTTTATIPVTITDDVPTIDNVVPLTVDEDDLASIGSDQNDDAFMSGSFSTTEGSDSVVKYQLDATADPLAGLTSQGEPVVLAETANGDGSFTYTATADGNAVFELVLKPDGSYTFTLQGPLDHAMNSDSLQIDFPIIATDFDGDTSTKILPVTIVDDQPSITNVDAISVDEDDLATIGSDQNESVSIDGHFVTMGSDHVVRYQLDASSNPVDGLTSHGVVVTMTESANADGSFTYTATAGSEAVFTLTVNSDGSYNFTLEGPIDHATGSDELTLNFPIIATDFDGDTTTETIPVTIVDDKPTITDVDAITVDEDDLGTIGSDQTDPISIDGNFTTTQGSDRVVSYQLDASATPVDGLTSQGVAVTLTETANADGSFTYQATAGTESVFTLTVNNDGSYNFTLEGPIDHAVDSDELTLNFPIIATDFDGDTFAETIPVKIVDDKPTLGGIEATSMQTVDEDDIPTVGSDGTQSNSIAGNFIATDGSDGIVEYGVSDLTTPVQGLTSGGQSLVMVEVSNAGGVSVYEARIDGTTTPVFRVTLDASDDSYTFDLLAPLDHPNADGQNELVINLPINATDFDGDESNDITLPITVVDDVPTIDGLLAGSEQTVDEDDLPAGTDAASAEDTVISGTFDITEGADQVASIQLSDLTTPVASLTSDGDAITLVLSSSANGVNVYQGVSGNPAEVVFELTLDATNNSYEFDLQKPLDHPDGNQQNEIIINLPVTATDNDGDKSPAFTLPITVVDDVPVVTNIESLRVDEDDLPLGSDGTKEPLTVSGEFDVTSADGIDAFELDLSSNPIPNLKSGGEEVTLSQDVGASTADALVYVGQTPGGVTVFTLTLHQDGKYDFELSGQLDHAVNSDEILLNLPVKITDGDNDTITATLPVTIVDDKPTIDAISSGSTLSVDEDDIPSQGSDDTPESNVIGGTFDVIDGADSIVSFQLDSLTSPVSGLTSGGQPLEMVEFSNSNGVIEYRAYVQGTTDIVFKLTLNGSADSYEFELLGALDHPAGNDENSLVINFPVNATDFDGDVSNNITLPITVVDDVPAIVKLTDSSQQTVDEDDLAGGSDTTSGDSTVLTGGFEVVDGADEIVSYQVSDLNAVVSGLTSNGNSIELNLVSSVGGVTSYEAVITGTSTKIFTLSLDANNDSYQFELLGPIDHDAVQGENNLVIDIPITVTDFDGDTSSSLNLPITIVDDIPEITSADPLVVDEDDLANGSQATNKDSLEATGNFDTVEGADTVVSYQLDLTSNPIPGVTSGGLAVTLVQTAVSNNNFTYQGQTPDGNSVFTLVLNADGSYKFTLEGALDHSTQGEDTLILDLPVFATDVDGDTAGINLPVTITDDVPTLYDESISRVEGQGSRTVHLFQDPVEGDDDLGADGAQITSFSADDSGIYFKQNGVDSDSVDLNGSDQVVYVHKVLDGVDTEIGRLIVRTDGRVSFRPNDDLDHTETDSIDFTINVVATDGDGDIADADVDISIRDRNAQIDTSTVTAFEDQGRDGVVVGVDSANTQDNLSTLDVNPAKVDLVINLHDIDRNESLGDITIRDADTHNGTFYYRDGSGNYIELTSVGNTVVLDASNVEQSFNGEFVSLDNLYFVPDRHTSTDASGIDPRIRVEILNNRTPDHTINGRLDIEVAAVADIATWTTSSEFNYSVDEDGNNVALNITAETQDTSNPEDIVYELVFTQGEGNAELVYSDGSAIPQTGGVYLVDASRIGDVQIDPIDNFSGEIKIDVTAITTENNNPLSGKETARSETETIIIDVNPIADPGSFTVNRINVFEDNARTQDTVNPVTDHDPLQLSEVITMKPSADLDGSEALFVRISDFSIDGVTLVWLDSANPSQIVEVTDSSGNVLYYEVPESELANVEVLPPLHSNDDFTFNVEGIVKDTASLSNGVAEDILSLGSKTVIVGVKGVADIPFIELNDKSGIWHEFNDGNVRGIETNIDENGQVELGFSVISGELPDNPNDHSESVTVLLSNIPAGVEVFDSDGASVDLTFVGYDAQNQPIYEANITTANINSGIVIKPEASSTENIHITATTIVTENDGHSRTSSGEIRIIVAPVIDAQDNYTVQSEGDEDTRFNIDWKPTLAQSPDTDEFFSEVTISGFPPGSTVYVDGVAQTLVSGTLTLSPLANESEQDFSARISQSGYVQVQLEQDSSTDFDLNTTVTVKEIDHEYVDASNPGQGIAEKTINGMVHVQVNPIVEPENTTGSLDAQTRLLVTESTGVVTDIVKSDGQGNIDFTINTSTGGESGANIIKYQEFDASSDEVVTQLVVQFHNVDPEILNQLVIVGALNEGGGRWTVIDEENFSIKAPSGLDLTPNDDSDDGDNGGLSQIGLTIYAEVNDLGEDAVEKDATVVRETDVTLEFPTVLTPQTSVAAEIQVADDVQIEASEDNAIDLGTQLTSKVDAINADGVEDVLTVVIDPSAPGIPPGLVITGTDIDFVNGKYVFQADIDVSGNITGLDGLTMHLAEDYAGDFELPVRFVTKDTESGDEKENNVRIPVQVLPIADVPSSAGDQPLDGDVTPNVTVDITGTLGLDANKQPVDDLNNDVPTADGVGYEDGLIQLNLNVDFADRYNNIQGGQETLTNIKLALDDTTLGEFVDANGNSLGTSIEFNEAEILAGALDNVLFKPKENYPVGGGQNTVKINIEGEITDEAVFDQSILNNPGDNIDIRTFTDDVTFEVTPVVDDITITGADPTKPITVVGDEDTLISLNQSGSGVSLSLNDNDGSESFVSLKLTGIPDDFVVQSNSSDYVVKNNGGGEWSIQLKDLTQTSVDLSDIQIKPPKNFSGEAEIGITVFIQEELLQVPTERTNNFTLVVNPIGDDVDVNPDTSAAGNEGEDIVINVNALVVDNKESIGDGATYQENDPETLRVEISNVPDGASVSLPDGTVFTDQGNGVFVLEIDAQDLDQVVFNSGDRNDNSWGGSLHFKVQAVDTGLDGRQSLGSAEEFDVAVDVEAVNDRPEFANVIDVETPEDNAILLDTFGISDVDAVLDDPTAEYVLNIAVDSGYLALNPSIIANYGLTVSGDGTGSIELKGTVSDLNAAIADGLVEFNPALNFFGNVNVDISVDDQGNEGIVISGVDETLNSNSSQFVIEVTEVNDAPTTSEVTLTSIDEDSGAVIMTAADLLVNAVDIESDNLTVSNVTLVDPAAGTLTQLSSTEWSFEPAPDFYGDVSFNYDITDDGMTNGVSDPKTVRGSAVMTVQAINDAPEIDGSMVTNTIVESSDQKISGIEITDVDFAGIHENEIMTVSLSIDEGNISVVIPAGSGITQGVGLAGETVLMGTLSQLNSLFASTDPDVGVFIDASDVNSNSIALTVTADDNGIFYDNLTGTSLQTSETFDINVTPVADVPNLAIDQNFSYIQKISASQSASRQGIALVGIMVALTDVDEVLALELTGVPRGATITSEATTSNISFDGTTWTVPEDEIDTLHINNAIPGDYDIRLTAVSTASNGDQAYSTPLDINLNVTLNSQDIDQSAESEDSYLIGSDAGITLAAGTGDDYILGGDGDDVLIGGLGSDILTGGAGSDIFKWTEDTVDNGAIDTITDFSVNEDTIDLKDVIADLNDPTAGIDDLLAHIQADYDASTENVSLNITTDANVQQTIVVENLGTSIDFNGLSSNEIVESLLNHGVIDNG
ncbi:retention module-containing protein [Vibrio diabolicus]|uniref:retention module-containing protein n=1 Tax=Vibrio diabolicus TaxID=50719 RepID=UPI0021602E70|nr:retention module-containing protein [Vibrio diabolicus]MCS0348142.1 retention module-containing protein [Vibrio diabolicus]MCS0361761.1 retention module-containing protein [Vibrio diabolicus]MCS0373057.1 retention module-containing protein [Vibrio diabolicus]MCS0426089.1 retention module-containing protein [Vibrio diabolicus]MCS0438467.1 retention module-containing protein [Vibrio diabolicus]